MREDEEKKRKVYVDLKPIIEGLRTASEFVSSLYRSEVTNFRQEKEREVSL